MKSRIYSHLRTTSALASLFLVFSSQTVPQTHPAAPLSTNSTTSTTTLPPPSLTIPSETLPTFPTTTPTPKAAAVPRYEALLDFWFGPIKSADYFPEDKAQQWSSNTPEMDHELRTKFEGDVKKAASGGFDDWRSTPRGRLALIILLDQMPRYIYRDKPQMFALDSMARGLVIEGIQGGEDKSLYPVERAFFYLPLQHAEDLNMQNMSIHFYTLLLKDSPDAVKPLIEGFLRSAILHQQIMTKFKRFPYRNRILGRQSTPEELIYLNQQQPISR